MPSKMDCLRELARRCHVSGVQQVEIVEINSPTPGVLLSTPHFAVKVEPQLGADAEKVRADVARIVANHARYAGDGSVYDVRLFVRFGL